MGLQGYVKEDTHSVSQVTEAMTECNHVIYGLLYLVSILYGYISLDMLGLGEWRDQS